MRRPYDGDNVDDDVDDDALHDWLPPVATLPPYRPTA